MNFKKTGQKFSVDLPTSSAVASNSLTGTGSSLTWSTVPWPAIIPSTLPSYATYEVTHTFTEYDCPSFFRDYRNNQRRARILSSNLVSNATMVIAANAATTTSGPNSFNVMEEVPMGGQLGNFYGPANSLIEDGNGLGGIAQSGRYMCKPRSFICVAPESFSHIDIVFNEITGAPTYTDLTQAPVNAFYYGATPITLANAPGYGNIVPQFYGLIETGVHTNSIFVLPPPFGVHTFVFELLEKIENTNRMY